MLDTAYCLHMVCCLRPLYRTIFLFSFNTCFGKATWSKQRLSCFLFLATAVASEVNIRTRTPLPRLNTRSNSAVAYSKCSSHKKLSCTVVGANWSLKTARWKINPWIWYGWLIEGKRAMLTWLQKLKESNRETRLFLFTAFIYVAAVAVPVLYCYLRLGAFWCEDS